MTVGVGAICDGGKAAVLAADRMHVYGSIHIEPESSKIVEVSNSVVAVISYSDLSGQKLGDELEAKTSEFKTADARYVADFVDARYRIHERFARERKLQSMLGADYPTFQKMVTESANSGILRTMADILDGTRIAVSVLILGTSKHGNYQIFEVAGTGMTEFDCRSFHAIGSGGLYANISLINRRYSRELPTADAIASVFEAKRASEIAYGVGRKTDLVLLRAGEPPRWFTESEQETLDGILNERPPLVSDDNRGRIQSLL